MRCACYTAGRSAPVVPTSLFRASSPTLVLSKTGVYRLQRAFQLVLHRLRRQDEIDRGRAAQLKRVAHAAQAAGGRRDGPHFGAADWVRQRQQPLPCAHALLRAPVRLPESLTFAPGQPLECGSLLVTRARLDNATSQFLSARRATALMPALPAQLSNSLCGRHADRDHYSASPHMAQHVDLLGHQTLRTADPALLRIVMYG